MIVYDGIKSDFLVGVERDTIAEEIEQNIYNKVRIECMQVSLL